MKKTIFLVSLCTSVIFEIMGQGCSDAGFCTVNSLKPLGGQDENLKSNHLKFGVSFGAADYAIAIVSNYLEYSRDFSNKFSISGKLTSIAQTGNNISAFGLSDLFLTSNIVLHKSLKATLGAKIPLNQADRSEDNLPLPLDYQSSLGTFDLILGLGYIIQQLQLVLALQQPLTQNKNAFLAEEYPSSSALAEFQSTNNFKRSGDILFRLSYPLDLSEKFKFTPSVLSIYHLTEDKFTNAAGEELNIKGSDGLTLNGNIYFDYSLNPKHHLQLNVAMPFITRESRPDGLTRSFIANLEYHFVF